MKDNGVGPLSTAEKNINYKWLIIFASKKKSTEWKILSIQNTHPKKKNALKNEDKNKKFSMIKKEKKNWRKPLSTE